MSIKICDDYPRKPVINAGCIHSHKTVLFDTIPIYSCVEAPIGSVCCESNFLIDFMKWFVVVKSIHYFADEE
jgi:hypothetical protein